MPCGAWRGFLTLGRRGFLCGLAASLGLIAAGCAGGAPDGGAARSAFFEDGTGFVE